MRRAFALGCLLVSSLVAPLAAAPVDDFKAACIATHQVSDAACACEADLAAKGLDEAEFAAVLANLNGKRQDYIAAINKMSLDQSKAFQGKLDELSAKSQAICNQLP